MQLIQSIDTASVLPKPVSAPLTFTYLLPACASLFRAPLSLQTFSQQFVLTSLSFLPDLSALSVVLQAGIIALVHLEPSPTVPGPVELVGSIEGGASAARWSPDMELLALITASRNLLLMTKEWDVLYETPIPESVACVALIQLISPPRPYAHLSAQLHGAGQHLVAR